MSEMHVSHTKPWSRMRSLSESCGGSKVTKPIFGNSGKRNCDNDASIVIRALCSSSISQVILVEL